MTIARFYDILWTMEEYSTDDPQNPKSSRVNTGKVTYCRNH